MKAAALPRAALAQMAGGVLMFGAIWPVAKYVIDAIPALWFATFRAALAAVALFAFLAALGRLRLPPAREWTVIVVIGLFQLAGFFALSHAALPWVPAGRTAILSNVTTVFIPPLALLVLHERIPPLRWVATALGLAGVAVLAGPWSIDWAAPGVLRGHALLLGAALSWSIAIIALRARPPRLPTLELLPWAFALAAVPLVLLAWADHAPPGPGAGAVPWAAALLVGLVAAPLGTWCMVAAQAALPSMVASIGFLALPAVSVVIATLWLGEPLGPDLVIGGGLILAGVLVVIRA